MYLRSDRAADGMEWVDEIGNLTMESEERRAEVGWRSMEVADGRMKV
jgi:hypothetical protein